MQVEHLIGMADRPIIMIQVIPQRVGVHEGLNGSFVIAESADTPTIVYLETAMTGFTAERPEHVAMVRLAYETLRAEALSPAASLSLMEEVAGPAVRAPGPDPMPRQSPVPREVQNEPDL